MEKYCPNCKSVFKNASFNFCSKCGAELKERVGREPIPSKLRHEVLQRDGYRCRECGASKEDTQLEIDHIIPVAEGGTNDISNLQTLCKACNRAKYTRTWVGGESNVVAVENELNNLQNLINEYEEQLRHVTNENDRVEYQYRIMKIKEEIPQLNVKLSELRRDEEIRLNKEFFFKKLYVLDDSKIQFLLNYIRVIMNRDVDVKKMSKDEVIMYILDNCSPDSVNDILNKGEEVRFNYKEYEANVRDNKEKIILLYQQDMEIIQFLANECDVNSNITKEDIIQEIVKIQDITEIKASINKYNENKEKKKLLEHTSASLVKYLAIEFDITADDAEDIRYELKDISLSQIKLAISNYKELKSLLYEQDMEIVCYIAQQKYISTDKSKENIIQDIIQVYSLEDIKNIINNYNSKKYKPKMKGILKGLFKF